MEPLIATIKESKMCPACYINGLLLLIFGATGAQIADNPLVIALSIILTLAGFWWMYRAYKRNKGKGGLKSNLRVTALVVLAFAGGYATAAYQTHNFWQEAYGAEDHLN